MAFVPTTWVDGSAPAITAAQMNRIEQGVDDAHAGDLDAGAIGTTVIANSAVTTVKIADAAVTTVKIADAAVTAAKVAAGAIAPAQTTFMSSNGASSGIYPGRLASGGSATRLPAGWSSAATSTGNYRVTHNLGTTNYAAVATAHVFAGYVVSVKARATSYVDLQIVNSATDANADAPVDLIIIRY